MADNLFEVALSGLKKKKVNPKPPKAPGKVKEAKDKLKKKRETEEEVMAML